MKNKITIIADPGSTWMGKKKYGCELIDVAKEAKCDAIKFQLFEGEAYRQSGNIELPMDLFTEFYQYGKQIGFPVTASVFDAKRLEFLMTKEVHHIKFGYSQRYEKSIQGLLKTGYRVVVTLNYWDSFQIENNPQLIKLYTQIEEGKTCYPALKENNFEGLFPHIFQGFSDHSLGNLQAQKAVQDGAMWIEKHLTLDYNDCLDCPDSKFALTPKQMKDFCWKVRP